MDNNRDEPTEKTGGAGDERGGPEVAGEKTEREGMQRGDEGLPFTDLNVPVEPDAPEDGAEDAGEEPPPPDGDLPEPDAERRPPRAATYVAFGVVVLAVLGVLMTVTSVRMYLRQSEMEQTLNASVERIADAYSGPGATDSARRRVAWLQQSLKENDLAQAHEALEALGRPDTGGASIPGADVAGADGEGPDAGLPGDGDDGSQGNLPEPRQMGDLPQGAQAYFAEHAEQWKPFVGFSAAIAQLRRTGEDVEELTALRSSMVEAARLGQADRVEELLGRAQAAVNARTGEELPDRLKQKLDAFGQAFARASEQRRDVREAARLAQQSERAARQGNIDRAERLMDRALAALEEAPRAAERRPPQAPQAGREPRGMPPMGPQVAFLRFVADVAGKVMRLEERDLQQVWDSINIAAGAIREKNAEQVREILDEARAALHSIGERRREMTASIAQAREQVESGRPSRERPSEGEHEERTEAVLRTIAGILARAREMPQEQFEEAQPELAKQLLAALTAPVEAREGPDFSDMSPEERVRAKMRLAGQMYMQLKRHEDADPAEVDDTFDRARELITEHEYERAEELVDEGVARMREMMAGLQGGLAPGADGYGPQLDLGGPEADAEGPSPRLQLPGTETEPLPSGEPGASDADTTLRLIEESEQ